MKCGRGLAGEDNPIEHVWNTAKSQIANIQHDDFTQTVNAFLVQTDKQIFNYKIHTDLVLRRL